MSQAARRHPESSRQSSRPPDDRAKRDHQLNPSRWNSRAPRNLKRIRSTSNRQPKNSNPVKNSKRNENRNRDQRQRRSRRKIQKQSSRRRRKNKSRKMHPKKRRSPKAMRW